MALQGMANARAEAYKEAHRHNDDASHDGRELYYDALRKRNKALMHPRDMAKNALKCVTPHPSKSASRPLRLPPKRHSTRLPGYRVRLSTPSPPLPRPASAAAAAAACDATRHPHERLRPSASREERKCPGSAGAKSAQLVCAGARRGRALWDDVVSCRQAAPLAPLLPLACPLVCFWSKRARF